MNTNADPARVKSAIAALPFPKTVKPDVTVNLLGPMTVSTAEIDWKDHKLSVLSNHTVNAPMMPVKNVSLDQCTVTVSGDEVSSLASIRQWIGIEPTSTSPNIGRTQFEYRLDGNKRIPLTSGDDYKAAFARGDVWTISLVNMLGITQARLDHFIVHPAR